MWKTQITKGPYKTLKKWNTKIQPSCKNGTIYLLKTWVRKVKIEDKKWLHSSDASLILQPFSSRLLIGKLHTFCIAWLSSSGYN